MAHNDSSTDNQRSRIWEFECSNSTPGDETRLGCALKCVRYLAYFSETRELNDTTRLHGFIYSNSPVSEKQMLDVLENASWKPIYDKLQGNEVYMAKKSAGLLTEMGVSPMQGRRKDLVGVKNKKRKTEVTEGDETIEFERKTRKTVEDIKTQLATSGQEADDLKTQLATSRQEAGDLKTQLATSRQEADDLKTQLATSKQESDDCTTQLATSRQEAGGLKTQLATSREESTDLTAQLKELETPIDTATSYVIGLLTTEFLEGIEFKRYNISTTLKGIYELQPPLRKDAKLVLNDGFIKALKTAKLHYHPDKQAKGNYWHRSICMEIAKLLNRMQEEYTKFPYQWGWE
jgi:predicted nuclease with TOPRIM domain